MSDLLWERELNFVSALLLHSCTTVLLKESLNLLTVGLRTAFCAPDKNGVQSSIVLDAYTSILSRDYDGELAELYFTNTGFALLAVSLASAVTMNLFVADTALNVIVAGTFGACWLISVFASRPGWMRLVLALRPAGRFIWSDTPFVNFFSRIYIASVLRGASTIQLRDYITLRSVAILELVFMKAYIASASIDRQIALLRMLWSTRLVLRGCKPQLWEPARDFPSLSRGSIKPFTTTQRMAVILLKTTVGHDGGSVRGEDGPGSVPIPGIGCFAEDDTGAGQWKIYRIQPDVLVMADCLRETHAQGSWARFIQRAHGILLRRLGKVRVVYLLRSATADESGGLPSPAWHSSVNFVSGISRSELQQYRPVGDAILAKGVVV